MLPARSRSSASTPMAAAERDRPRSLSPELAARLARAACVADYEQLGELIAAIPPEHASLAEELGRLMDRYAYEEIQRRLDLDAGKPLELGVG